MTRTIYRERIPATDPRCRRHVLHDSDSRRYETDTTGLTPTGFDWPVTAGPLDQGQAGACTAGASLTNLMLGPFAAAPAIASAVTKAFGGFTQPGIYSFYNDEENLDGDGPYPPNDNGSTGLTAAKVLRAKGVISGWTQTFGLNAALTAGQKQPFITGTLWFNSMFEPNPEGIITVDPKSGVAGGHEWTVIGYDPARGLVKMRNDWGAWGIDGTGVALLEAERYGYLLDQQGDTTFFALPSQPAPTPVPPTPGDPDAALAAVAHPWVRHLHTTIAGNAGMRAALKAWLAAKNL